MKAFAKRTTAFLMACAMCCSLLIGASAVTVNKVTHKSPQYGGGSATVFYVNTKNKNTAQLQYTSTSWYLTPSYPYKYAYSEIKIWGRNKTGAAWNYISKTNVAGKNGATISMKGYTQYKVRVYSWKTSTIGSYIGGKWGSNSFWSDGYSPECTFTAKSRNIKSLAK